jgi:hypothetical protein
MAQPLGMLIYTRDGHMSVQLMYPKSANAPSNEYLQDGYEASFGSYDVDEATHTVTHHVQGSITRDRLGGKDLPRVYQFSADGHLSLSSPRSGGHASQERRYEHGRPGYERFASTRLSMHMLLIGIITLIAHERLPLELRRLANRTRQVRETSTLKRAASRSTSLLAQTPVTGFDQQQSVNNAPM